MSFCYLDILSLYPWKASDKNSKLWLGIETDESSFRAVSPFGVNDVWKPPAFVDLALVY